MYLKLVLLFLNMRLLCACQALNKPVPPPEVSTPQMVVFKATLSKGQGIALNFYDSNFRYGLIKLENRQDTSKVLFKTVAIHIPTAFRYAIQDKNDFFKQRSIIAFPGDTISILIDATEINMSSNRSALNVLNRLLEPVSLKAFSSNNYLLKDFSKTQDSLQQRKAAMSDSIQILSAQYRIPTEYTRAFLQYNELLYYNESFKLKYESYTPQFASVLQRLQSLRNALFNDSLFGSINCTEAFMLIYNMLQATNTAKNIKNTNVLDHAAYFDPRLHKTKLLSGYLLDFVDAESHTLIEKEKNIAKIKPFLNTQVLAAPSATVSKLPDNVLSTTLQDFQGRPYTLQSLLSQTSKKLIVLDFWASWCVPCIEQMPALKKLEKKHEQEMQVFSISIDAEPGKWVEASKKYGIQSNAYLIANPKASPLIQHFEISTIPRYVVLDNQGNLISDDFYRPNNPQFSISIQEIYRGLK